ncbi:MAG: hypothetical protein GY822_22280 [Deltaproteobacteria bacterium]|nr:hypothetical protein [Deltaproteobacteria bacterium]
MTRRSIIALGITGFLVVTLSWVLYGAYFGTPGDKSTMMRCIGVRCGFDMIACARDPECSTWLDCMQGCGDDNMDCPTRCGAYYQSPNINAFTQCGLKNKCIDLNLGSLPKCGAPEVSAMPLENVDGTWWVVGIKGPDYALYDDCQRFVYTTLGPTEIRAQNSVPLTLKGEMRICKNEGKYTRRDDGVMELVYENWEGYLETWKFTHHFENSMLAYVCSASNQEEQHDYGAFILSRVPLAELDAEEHAKLIHALRDTYRLELDEMTPLKIIDCPNP